MKTNRIIKNMTVLLLGAVVSLSGRSVFAATRKMSQNEMAGKAYFEGSKSFQNGGPACISCHSVKIQAVAHGGLFAKDLTDVYSRMGEGIGAWLSAPSFPAMAASYQGHSLTEKERAGLTAFLKFTNDAKSNKATADNSQIYMLLAGIGGLAGILILISLLWYKRKRSMVKQAIFDRQSRAWDARH